MAIQQSVVLDINFNINLTQGFCRFAQIGYKIESKVKKLGAEHLENVIH